MNETSYSDPGPVPPSSAPSEQVARREHLARAAENRRFTEQFEQNRLERRVSERLLGNFALRIYEIKTIEGFQIEIENFCNVPLTF